MPKAYTEVPKLGPALPGDLGRPILRAQEEGRHVVPPNVQAPRADPEEQRRLAEIEAARIARAFTGSRGARTAESPAARGEAVGGDPAAGLVASSEPPQIDPGAAPNRQDRKLAVVNAAADRRTVSPDDEPEKLTVALPAAVHRDLAAYAESLAWASGEGMPPDPGKLVAPMLQRFMAADKGFRKEKRETEKS